MWANTFGARLYNWNLLRAQCQTMPVQQTVASINSWWFESPWQPYYLHWDDQKHWPDPWQLLSDNIYCDLARGLGILYTISMLDRVDMTPVDLVLTDTGHNLVLVTKEKYILNWTPDSVVNTNQEIKFKQQYQQHEIT